jgi:hypothetical protein
MLFALVFASLLVAQPHQTGKSTLHVENRIAVVSEKKSRVIQVLIRKSAKVSRGGNNREKKFDPKRCKSKQGNETIMFQASSEEKHSARPPREC